LSICRIQHYDVATVDTLQTDRQTTHCTVSTTASMVA